MDPFIAECLNLLLRFLHLVTGVAWIGASFYFIWLDNHLQKPPQWKAERGIKGDLWAIHGGGFYEVAKYQMAPPELPETLHWFKWEAYTTWLTGFLLLVLMYYVGAESYLIDPRVMDLSQAEAVSIGLGVLVAGWLVYDLLCNTALAKHGKLLGVILLGFITLLAWGLSEVFSARGAYIHVGAVIGTVMAGNVFRTIIPSQKALVAAVAQGKEPDPSWAGKAKLRSTHNTYLTLPLLFIMISNHYPITYNHSFSWLVLVALIIITAVARRYFVLRHFGQNKPAYLIGAVLAAIVLAVLIAPKRHPMPSQSESKAAAEGAIAEASSKVSIDTARVQEIIQARCSTCHSATPSDEIFTVAPAGMMLDDLQSMEMWAPRIKARTIDSEDMPLMNKTKMTAEERQYLAQWIASLNKP